MTSSPNTKPRFTPGGAPPSHPSPSSPQRIVTPYEDHVSPDIYDQETEEETRKGLEQLCLHIQQNPKLLNNTTVGKHANAYKQYQMYAIFGTVLVVAVLTMAYYVPVFMFDQSLCALPDPEVGLEWQGKSMVQLKLEIQNITNNIAPFVIIQAFEQFFNDEIDQLIANENLDQLMLLANENCHSWTTEKIMIIERILNDFIFLVRHAGEAIITNCKNHQYRHPDAQLKIFVNLSDAFTRRLKTIKTSLLGISLTSCWINGSTASTIIL